MQSASGDPNEIICFYAPPSVPQMHSSIANKVSQTERVCYTSNEVMTGYVKSNYNALPWLQLQPLVLNGCSR